MGFIFNIMKSSAWKPGRYREVEECITHFDEIEGIPNEDRSSRSVDLVEACEKAVNIYDPLHKKAYQEYHKGELMFVLVSDATGHIWAGNKDMSSSTDKLIVLTNAYRLLGEYYVSAAELSTFNTLNYRKTDQISYVELPGYKYAVTCSQELEDEIKKC